MKVKQIMLKNFATVNEIQMDFTDDITYLIGENGSGKTTCGLNAIWFVLEGIAKTGKKALHADRFRFIGKYGKSAIGQITLHDEKEGIEIYIQRKMTKDATKLQIATSDGRVLDADFVDKIFNIFSINPEGFSRLSSREQAASLGIDTSVIDAKKKAVYDQRRELGYAVKSSKGILDEYQERLRDSGTEKAEFVDVQTLLEKKAKIDNAKALALTQAQEARIQQINEAIAHNKVQNDLLLKEKIINQQIGLFRDKLSKLNDEIGSVKRQLATSNNQLTELPDVVALMETDIPVPEVVQQDISPLIEEIDKAERQNVDAAAWIEFERLDKKYAEAVDVHDKKDREYQALEQDRVKYLKSCDLPFSNVTINDSGELLVDGRPFCDPYFSKGEILSAGIKIAATMNPELKYVFIPNAQSLDEKSREKLFAELIDNGFQIVVEMVGTEKNKDHSTILLKESRIVDDYEEQKNTL